MAAFYTHLKSGMSKAESLRAAQTEVRQKYPSLFYRQPSPSPAIPASTYSIPVTIN
jgi:CHAT domain-containing protein